MLQRLDIKDIALIDSVSIDFTEGLNIMTGETGAGKTIIINSLNAIMGERVSRELIRTGKDKAVICAEFWLNSSRIDELLELFGIDSEDDGTLIIIREFTTAGKNICRINGTPVTVSMLKSIGQWLADLHGQHDNQSLLRTESHMELLDSFGGKIITELRTRYTNTYSKYIELNKQLKNLELDKMERERRISLLRFQINDIDSADLKDGEEEELIERKALLSNATKICDALSKTYLLLYEGEEAEQGAFDKLTSAKLYIDSISNINQNYASYVEKLNDILFSLEDIKNNIRNDRDEIDMDPSHINEIEERLNIIFTLKRKYGAYIREILDYKMDIEKELFNLERGSEVADELIENIANIHLELWNLALQLNEERTKAAQILENNIANEFNDLEMKNSKFEVQNIFDTRKNLNDEYQFLSTGLNKIEFMISTNTGEPLKPLSKIASGGEMSRIMLAIKTILADVDQIPTLIFDEVDTGISGIAARKIAEKLSKISMQRQVICITHLPQIAAMGDNNLFIYKETNDNRTLTLVEKLNQDEAVNEVARIAGGFDTVGAAGDYARELIYEARKFKQNLHKK
jgi:DNA repair protein RecN (Recombination protein N)